MSYRQLRSSRARRQLPARRIYVAPPQEPVFLGPGGVPIQKQTMSCYSGDLSAKLTAKTNKDLEIHWEAAPIPLLMWRQITAFLKWAYDEHNCEAQVRLAYNPDTREWRTAVLPQTIMLGLASKEFEVDKDRETAFQEAGINDGFGFVGTVHQHCAASAFQSGTDHADELKQPGFHVTLGHLNTKKADWHSRASFCGIMYPEVNDSEWLPYDMDEVLSLENLPEFPAIWRTRLKKREYRTTHHSGGYQVTGRGHNGKNAWNSGYQSQGRGYSYCGAGYGDPDQLPLEAGRQTSTQYQLKTREYFWDYMIAVYRCFEFSDMQKKLDLLPQNSLAWKKACIDGGQFAEFISSCKADRFEKDQMCEFFCDLFTNKKLRFSGNTKTWSTTKNNQAVAPLALYQQFGPNGKTPLAELRRKLDDSKVVPIGEPSKKPKGEQLILPEAKKPKLKPEPELNYDYLDGMEFGQVFDTLPPAEANFSIAAENLSMAIASVFETSDDFAAEMETLLAESVEKNNEEFFLKGGDYTPSETLLTATKELAGLIAKSTRSIAFARVVSQHHITKKLEEFGWDTAIMDRFFSVLGESCAHSSIGLLRSAHQTTPHELESIIAWLQPHLLELVIKAKRDYM